MTDKFSSPIAQAFWQACVTELEALKPGNVSVYAAGHGMQVDDFLLSAERSAAILSKPDLSVGERIFLSIQATRAAVNCNTNLGIVLLCAPLAQAALDSPPEHNLWHALERILQQLSVSDTEFVFRAIRLAEPAGLGRSERHDVRQAAAAPLREVMACAAERDRIAYQYANGFGDIFDIGLPRLRQYLAQSMALQWAAAGVYLNFLANFPDSHIMRKFGAATAEQIRRDAHDWRLFFDACDQPEQALEALLGWDRQLKQQGINPGTSADLTVATLFVQCLENVYSSSQHTRTEACVS